MDQAGSSFGVASFYQLTTKIFAFISLFYLSFIWQIKEMEIVAKKIEVENITPKTTIMTRAKKALMSCKETVLDRTFFLPMAIVCTLFTVQAFSGWVVDFLKLN